MESNKAVALANNAAGEVMYKNIEDLIENECPSLIDLEILSFCHKGDKLDCGYCWYKALED